MDEREKRGRRPSVYSRGNNTVFLKDFIKNVKPWIKPITFKGMMRALRKPKTEPKKFSEATDMEKAYVAEWFDVKGNFGITLIGEYYRPSVYLKAPRKLAYELCCKYGGFISKKEKPKQKPRYRWWITQNKILTDFLNGIIPYLKTKQQQAKLLLEALGIIENNGWTDATRAEVKKIKQSLLLKS